MLTELIPLDSTPTETTHVLTRVPIALTFSYSVSETVDRQEIDGINGPPDWCCGSTSLATDSAPDDPWTPPPPGCSGAQFWRWRWLGIAPRVIQSRKHKHSRKHTFTIGGYELIRKGIVWIWEAEERPIVDLIYQRLHKAQFWFVQLKLGNAYSKSCRKWSWQRQSTIFILPLSRKTSVCWVAYCASELTYPWTSRS